jgi:predicted transcriptional regulator
MTPAPPSQGESETPEDAETEGGGSLTGRFREEQELLRRHIRILKVVMENEPVGIIKLAELTDYPQHKVRYSLRVLEQEGLINPTPMGAKTTEKVEEFLPELADLVDSMQTTVEELRSSLE